MRSACLTMLVAALALAGCAAEGPALPDPAAPASDDVRLPADTQRTVEIPWDGSIAAAGPFFGADLDYFLDGPRGGAFEVPPEAQYLVTTADGSCTSGPACSFRFALFHGDEEVASVRGTLPLVIELAEPAPGSWQAHLFTDGDGSAMVEASGVILIETT